MFVVSFHASKRKITVLCCVLAVVILAGVGIAIGRNALAEATGTTVYASNNQQRISFLEEYGWKVSKEPNELVEVVIPATFDDVYQEYNNIQLMQKMDLTPYQGKTCQKYTYAITNYPDQPDHVVAHLLVYENKIVGGDVSSTEAGGFIHGFFQPAQQEAASSQ